MFGRYPEFEECGTGLGRPGRRRNREDYGSPVDKNDLDLDVTSGVRIVMTSEDVAFFSDQLPFFRLFFSAVSSLDSYSKDSYSSPFLADSTDSRVWAFEYESGTR